MISLPPLAYLWYLMMNQESKNKRGAAAAAAFDETIRLIENYRGKFGQEKYPNRIVLQNPENIRS
ncbi:hypothetical protein OUZ56_030151 [Daphnia magna]|uniref:Uncharacterized protein n=1 Tax=Daphnia magna TaxID=35525 RepID=A0ABQ9ZQH5_9CRUS|nr:hypothetical protein OUZ56_030151 [Daphnia magna]